MPCRGKKMCAQAWVCVFHGRVTKLREEMGRDKNRGLTQAELSDWIKRSAWQPGRLALAHCSCHPLATHLAHKTLAQLAEAGYSLHSFTGHMRLSGTLFLPPQNISKYS